MRLFQGRRIGPRGRVGRAFSAGARPASPHYPKRPGGAFASLAQIVSAPPLSPKNPPGSLLISPVLPQDE
jgi:hypothetical protein